MYIRIPDGVIEGVFPEELFANEETLAKYEIHPGDELYSLGYPLGAEANLAGFPILRSGKIASYPLLPIKETKTFLLDFNVFPGNSGGPVYLASTNRAYGGAVHIGTTYLVMGLVSRERSVVQQTAILDEVRQRKFSLGLAEIVHASLIKETLQLLPPPAPLP